MSDMADGSAGVWQHISQRTPAPERDEIAQLIGHKIIDQNKVRHDYFRCRISQFRSTHHFILQDLFMELTALKDIIFEASGGRAGSSSTGGRNKRASGLRGLSLAQQFSQLHYQDSEKSFTNDEIFSIRSFTLEIVNERMDDIRQCFEAEKAEIELEIERLTDSLDEDYGADASNDSDAKVAKSMSNLSIHTSSAPSPVPTDRLELCSMCNIKRPTGHMVSGASRNTSFSFVCSTCETARNRREAKMGTVLSSSSTRAAGHGLSHSQNTPANLTSVEDNHLNSPRRDIRRNNNEDSPDSAPKISPRGASSKFRNRIDSARYEHHFIDEF